MSFSPQREICGARTQQHHAYSSMPSVKFRDMFTHYFWTQHRGSGVACARWRKQDGRSTESQSSIGHFDCTRLRHFRQPGSWCEACRNGCACQCCCTSSRRDDGTCARGRDHKASRCAHTTDTQTQRYNSKVETSHPRRHRAAAEEDKSSQLRSGKAPQQNDLNVSTVANPSRTERPPTPLAGVHLSNTGMRCIGAALLVILALGGADAFSTSLFARSGAGSSLAAQPLRGMPR